MTGSSVLVHVEPAMGTMVSLRLAASPAQRGAAAEAIVQACERLHSLEDELTTWDPASPMSLVRDGVLDLADAPWSVRQVVERCTVVHALSGGWFDPWSLPGGLDPTGLAKGWILEEAMAPLRSFGGAGVVNGGGDVCTTGGGDLRGGAWALGVQHPWRADRFACVLAVRGAVATSGAYQRGQHLFDPRAGTLAVAAASATVVGPDLTVADGLATALAVGGDEVLDLLEDLVDYEGYLIRCDGTERTTSGVEFVGGDDARPACGAARSSPNACRSTTRDGAPAHRFGVLRSR